MRIWLNKRLSHHLQVSDTLRSVTYSSTPFLVDNPEITSRSLANVVPRNAIVAEEGDGRRLNSNWAARFCLQCFEFLQVSHRRKFRSVAADFVFIVGCLNLSPCTNGLAALGP
jgi:hypothetical protein